jgi:anti-sigma factor (TIGR02949 family)
MSDHDHIQCEEVIAHLLAYLDGELDDVKRAQIDRHLEACRGCFSRAEFEKELRNRVKQIGEGKAPASLKSRIKSLIDSF